MKNIYLMKNKRVMSSPRGEFESDKEIEKANKEILKYKNSYNSEKRKIYKEFGFKKD